MQRSQLEITPTIAKLLNIEYEADESPIEEIVEEFKDFDEIFLLIVDSLGFNVYTDYNFEYLKSIEGMVFEPKSVARVTTPVSLRS
jgi:predicted AAA+ superfamily ATPase